MKRAIIAYTSYRLNLSLFLFDEIDKRRQETENIPKHFYFFRTLTFQLIWIFIYLHRQLLEPQPSTNTVGSLGNFVNSELISVDYIHIIIIKMVFGNTFKTVSKKSWKMRQETKNIPNPFALTKEH